MSSDAQTIGSRLTIGRAWCWLTLVLAGLLLVLQPVRATTTPGDLPALVGRLTVLSGDVRWYDRASAAWTASTESQPLRNWPLVAGDRLRTGAGGRAEIRIGSTTLRLGAGAELWLPRLDEQSVLLHLQDGSLAVRLSEVDGDGFGPVEILTREGRWLPQSPGHYRLDRERDATQATAWRGTLRFESHDSALTIPAGRRADLWQDPPGTTRYAWAGIERDAFADWVARDERQDDAPSSARYVPPGMTGWQDLDRYGDWRDDPDYGSVWQPRVVAPGWAPFQDGRWAWVAPWGWTWIDAAPWGFAPFHYGSWVVVQGRWSWWPGSRHERTRYAPALSAWVSGAQWGISVGIGERRPPPPRVVVPIRRPPVVHPPFVRPPPIVLPPPRQHPPAVVRPPFTGPREPDRQDRGDRDPRRDDGDRDRAERREHDRRDRDARPSPPAVMPDARPSRPQRPDGRTERDDVRPGRGESGRAPVAATVAPPPGPDVGPPAPRAQPPHAGAPREMPPARAAAPAPVTVAPPPSTGPMPPARPPRDAAAPSEGRNGHKPGRDGQGEPDPRTRWRRDGDERGGNRP